MIKAWTYVAAIILLPSAHASTEHLEKARNSLRNYGLVNCLTMAFPDPSELTRDLENASRSYHFMGRGHHEIRQDEETLEATKDPYKIINNHFSASLKNDPYEIDRAGNQIVSMRCLEIYNSASLEELVRSFDEYVIFE